MTGLFIICTFLFYLASFIPGIILLVRLIQMGIACIKLGNFAPKERIRFMDSHRVKVIWNWTLVLIIVAAICFFAMGFATGEAALGVIFGLLFPIVYLSPQIAVLIAGKIIMNKYSDAFVRYKTWERRQNELAAKPVIEALVMEK